MVYIKSLQLCVDRAYPCQYDNRLAVNTDDLKTRCQTCVLEPAMILQPVNMVYNQMGNVCKTFK